MDQGAVFSTGKSGPIFLRQTKNQSQAGDFRGNSTARNRFYRIVGGWAWHALFFL